MAYETIVIQQGNSRAPRPARGRHAEQLAECEQWLNTLQALIKKERDGVFDGLGNNWWLERDTSKIGSHPDPLINTARRILLAAETRLAEYQDENRR